MEDIIKSAIRAPDQLGHYLQRIRKIKKLSQNELANLARLRQGTVSKIEKGVKTTQLATIFAVCNALELELVVRERRKGKIKDVFK